MNSRSPIWRSRLSRAVLLAFITSLVPAPGLAADQRSAPGPSGLRAAVQKGPASAPRRSRDARAASRATQDDAGQNASFFKSKPGILALAVMIAGAGYAVYSTQNDRIKSPGAK